MMNSFQVDLIRDNFKALAPRGEELMEQFFSRLFAKQPMLRGLFPKHPEQVGRDVLAALGVVVKNLNRLEIIDHVLASLGAKNLRVGVEPQHYGIAREALISSMRDLSDTAWDDELEAAWGELLTIITSVMIRGAGRARVVAA
jgi:hemoglobin-like flavoprotein